MTGIALMVAISGFSGLTGQLSTPPTWLADRVATETLYFGAPVDELIAQGEMSTTRATDPGIQRPARVAPDRPMTPEMGFSPEWGRVFYTQDAAVMGYVNLKGSASFEQIEQDLFYGSTPDRALAFWAAPGLLIRSPDDEQPTTEEIAGCIETAACGTGLTVDPEAYSTGHLSYAVTATKPFRVQANEAYYRGWKVTACSNDDTDSCSVLPSKAGAHGEVTFTVPRGDWTVSLEYRLPGLKVAWIAFALGSAVLILGAILSEILRRRRSRAERIAA